MLRRYLITNVITSALLYGAIWLYVPSVASVAQSFNSTLNTFVMGDIFLAPLLQGMIAVSAR